MGVNSVTRLIISENFKANFALKRLSSYGKYRMASTQAPVNIAILDDYQNVALKFADWSRLQDRSQVTVFNDHVSDPAALVERLKPFEVISVMRERTPLPRSIIEQLPNLKLIASNAPRNASIELAAAKEYGIIAARRPPRSAPIQCRSTPSAGRIG